MKATGIVRRIDDLGRIVIPKEIRRTMRIREGDPLEIYTDRDGEVIFKKYSPMVEMSDFSSQLCEALYKTTGHSIAISDRDTYIAACGVPKRELAEKHVSGEVEKIMEARGAYRRRAGDKAARLLEESDKYTVAAASPVLSEGDVMGCIVFFNDSGKLCGEVEDKLAQAASSFLGKHLES